jgi:3',5'-cyclic AMP phosphodiesterase CpdA
LRVSEFGLRNKILLAILVTVVLAVSSSFAAQHQQIQQKLAALDAIQGKFSFVVVGDNRSGHEIYSKIVALIVERKPDFVVNTGDMIKAPGNKKEWTAFWEMSKPITAPYFLTVGNHDAYAKVRGSEETYKQQVDQPGNELYYSFTAGNSLFIVLDSYLAGEEKKIAGEQLAWLEGVLANSSRKHVFVFLHHPLYTDPAKGQHANDSLDKYPENRDKLQALFAKHGVTAVFAGHEHYYHRRTVDGILHIITGGGGAPLHAREEDGGFHHFIRMTIDGNSVAGEVVDVNGKIRDRF